jgi:hypothetical protein
MNSLFFHREVIPTTAQCGKQALEMCLPIPFLEVERLLSHVTKWFLYSGSGMLLQIIWSWPTNNRILSTNFLHCSLVCGGVCVGYYLFVHMKAYFWSTNEFFWLLVVGDDWPDIVLQNQIIVYDNNLKRLGWKNFDCKYNQLLKHQISCTICIWCKFDSEICLSTVLVSLLAHPPWHQKNG